LSKVVGIHGNTPVSREPNETVIRELERILEMAKSGEVVGFAGALLHADKLSTVAYGGLLGTYGLVGALDVAKDHIKKLVEGE